MLAVKSGAFTEFGVRTRSRMVLWKSQLQFYYSMKGEIHLRGGRGEMFCFGKVFCLSSGKRGVLSARFVWDVKTSDAV